MLISELLANVEVQVSAEVLSLEVDFISADTRNFKDGALFFLYKGTDFYPINEVKKLYEEGRIAAVVCEEELPDIKTIVVGNCRQAFAIACSNYFGRAYQDLTMVAVTGTNGKTTITWILDRICAVAGIKTVRIGTTGAVLAGSEFTIEGTTPSAYDFHRILQQGVEKGASIVIAEASSHALGQDRLYGIPFDIAIFTNLSGDHLDYHKNMESYYQAKKKLFVKGASDTQVINIGDKYGLRLYNELDGKKYSYGIYDGDLKVIHYDLDHNGITAKLSFRGSEINITCPLVGQYNLENILASIEAALILEIPLDAIQDALATLPNIKGRLEKYEGRGIAAFVDYAHTDDALANVLTTLRRLSPKRLITVFGAGGDRDNTKRPRMGKVAQDLSDLSIVTTDNPRSEDPQAIINEIVEGMTGEGEYIIEVDRAKAINLAIERAQEGDMVLIAGKGHEEYQIIGQEKHPFSDAFVVKEALRK